MNVLLMILLAATADPPVEQTKKNIKILHGLPSSQLIPVMSFMANSLGVTCAHCHAKAFESDEKPAKNVARAHLQMTQAINKQHFAGALVVTCNSCHQGQALPAATPSVANAGWLRTTPTPVALPEAKTIVDRYLATRPAQQPAVRGAIERFSGREAPVSGTFSFDGEKFDSTLSHPPEADRAMLALLAKPPLGTFTNWTTVARDGNAWVLSAIAQNGRTERFYFDATTGLLIRRTRETPTPIGNLPEQFDFSDYRDGLPRRLQWSRADYRVTFIVGD